MDCQDPITWVDWVGATADFMDLVDLVDMLGKDMEGTLDLALLSLVVMVPRTPSASLVVWDLSWAILAYTEDLTWLTCRTHINMDKLHLMDSRPLDHRHLDMDPPMDRKRLQLMDQ